MLFVAVVWLSSFPGLLAEGHTVKVTRHFNENPHWDGYRNRLLPEKLPIIRQNFGHQESNHAGGGNPGEIGGTVQRSVTRAYYAKVIPGRTFHDKLAASGKVAVTRADGGSGVLIGWFHHTSRGWRTPNSIGFRIDGNGGNYRLFYEYGTSKWRTGGGGAFEGPRWQTTKTKPFQADGTIHQWSLAYDPDGNEKQGIMAFTLDGKTYPLPLSQGHKFDGANFNRFGIWNLQANGDRMDFYIDDLVLDGTPQDFSSDAGWEGVGNQVEFEERIIRPFHDFGFSRTNHTGGEPGELGGIIYRDEKPAYYGARVEALTLENELEATGKIALTDAGSDSAFYLGWLDSATKKGNKIPEHKARQKNYLAILVEGPSRVGHYFRPSYGSSTGEGLTAPHPVTRKEPPIIRPDGRVHEWSMRYSPSGAGGKGQIRITLDGEAHTLNLRPGDKARGAKFDRFGIFNMQSGGHHVRVYIDELTHTSKAKTGN